MLPFNRALHLDDYDDPTLKPYAEALLAFEREIGGTFYRKDHAHRTWEYANCLQQLEALYPGGGPLKIHDTGSGGSYFPLYLRKKLGHEVSVSDSMAYGNMTNTLIRQCLKLRIEIPLVADPVEALVHIPDDSFDVTLCISVIEHVAADKYEEAWRELERVTKPGGHVFVTSDYFRDAEQAEKSPFRNIQHTCLTEALVLNIPVPLAFVGGVDLQYKGDFVHNYSFINLCFQKPA